MKKKLTLMNKNILHRINKYYSDKIVEHGAISQGVDWNSKESHFIRFEQLCKVFTNKENFSLLDFGCGYGALIDYLYEANIICDYIGFDISEKMILKAKENYFGDRIKFTNKLNESTYDFTIANGIFNVKLDNEEEEWEKYIIETIEKINTYSNIGFSFNILSSYSDKEYQRDYLHYANPTFYFDYCKKHFSRKVALLHDYDHYEFTILVVK